MKMEDEESGRKHSISSFDSLGKGEERKRVRRSPFSPQLVTYNRINEASEIEVGSRASRGCSNRTRVSSKSSWRILLGISAPVKHLGWSRGDAVTRSGTMRHLSNES